VFTDAQIASIERGNALKLILRLKRKFAQIKKRAGCPARLEFLADRPRKRSR
jgi:hypothetical protein